MKTLRERLKDWQDWDVAAFELGVVLGLWAEDTFQEQKSTFWARNPIGSMLHETLLRLAQGDVLETDEDRQRFRAQRAHCYVVMVGMKAHGPEFPSESKAYAWAKENLDGQKFEIALGIEAPT